MQNCHRLIYNSRNYKGLLFDQKADRRYYIYNSRNYKGLLFNIGGEARFTPSTTVEIIRDYYSLHLGVSYGSIYNSRNYKGLLFKHKTEKKLESTTVEIIRDYYSESSLYNGFTSTTVEIIRDYYSRARAILAYNLQQ